MGTNPTETEGSSALRTARMEATVGWTMGRGNVALFSAWDIVDMLELRGITESGPALQWCGRRGCNSERTLAEDGEGAPPPPRKQCVARQRLMGDGKAVMRGRATA